MSSAVTASMRARGWNVLFTIADNRYLAGIYQNPRKPTVTFGDVCRELALCFEYPYTDPNTADGTDYQDRNDGAGESSWASVAFALAETPDQTEEDDPAEYPAFVTQEAFDTVIPGLFSANPPRQRTITYHLVRHRQPCNPAASSLQDHIRGKCAGNFPDPRRRRHPSYLPPDNTEHGDMLVPDIMGVDMDAAEELASDFRLACISRGTRCAVSGEGDPWCPGQLIGPGVHACHIVPQQHYHLYPMPDQQNLAQEHRLDQLRLAWERTWSPNNGILLLKQLHDCFDARLFSIHPKTLCIRIFVPYGLLERYHGQKAQVNTRIDRNALAHHYDMCCIENMAAERPNVTPASGEAAGAVSGMKSPATNLSGRSTPFSDPADFPLTPA